MLTTVTSVSPSENAVASAATDVSATFDLDVTPGTATDQTFIVEGRQSGRRVGAATTVSSAGPVITHDPAENFMPGERVRVTVTSDVATTGGAANKKVYEFRTEVTSGSGQFVDTGQDLGINIGGRALFGDLDGDGDVDILERGNFVWVNDGTGTFADSGQNLGAGAEPALGDVDGDGDIDIVGDDLILLNNGDGVFTAGQDITNSATASIGDLDGDGDLDLVQGVNYGAKRVWLNDGNGQFTNTNQSLGSVSSLGIGLGDLDGDGDLDIFSANSGVNGARVWLNDGNAVFSDTGQDLGGFRSRHDVDLGDIDNDGDLDAVVANEYQNTGGRIWVNDGNGVFADSGQQIDPTFRGRRAEFGDVDGDGDLDVFYVVLWGGSSVWLNDGGGTFSNSGQRLLRAGDTNANRRVEGGALADVDGDGDLDLFEANFATRGSRVWINQNLTPSVSLSIDNTTLDEDGGAAEVTATLEAAHTDPVTIDLATSGTATETEDYTISAKQIVIAVGETTGSVTVMAIQDPGDEPDEIVTVDIESVVNAQEQGTQQVSTTIIDDDLPIPVPEVTLAVDDANIPEDGGVATFTFTLSEVTTVAVTIDGSISGTASQTDFVASATQVVVAPGATTGTITVTATDDQVDEPDETVEIEITNVIGGTELGNQSQSTTITDDDEPVVPDVTIATDNGDIAEGGGVATVTASLSEVTTVPVTVVFGLSGTASENDYTVSATEVVIAPGGTTGSITVTAVQDEVNEPNETIDVEVADVTNGNEDGDQQLTITIFDDDIPPSFSISSFVPNASGFYFELTNALNQTGINLYDTSNAGMGPADVMVVGENTGPVTGSLVFGTSDDGPAIEATGNGISFIATGGPLEPDTYFVTLRSAEDAFVDTEGALLDGDGDGNAGDDYETDFTIDEAPSDARVISLPDFVRGPGQEVNLPANSTVGIPISLSDGDNVRAVDLRISYDPALLEITGASAPAGGSVTVNTLTPGLAILVFFSASSLPAGETEFVQLEANVPTDNASTNYGKSQVLDVHGVIIGDGNDNEFPAIVDDSVHLTSFFADVSGNGRINAADAAGVARVAALIDFGFASSLVTDPTLIGDISGNTRINAADASLVARFAALIPVDQIPALPSGVVIAGVPTPEGSRLEGGGTREEIQAVEAFPLVEDFGSPAQRQYDHAVDSVLTDSDSDDEDLSGELIAAIEALLTSQF